MRLLAKRTLSLSTVSFAFCFVIVIYHINFIIKNLQHTRNFEKVKISFKDNTVFDSNKNNLHETRKNAKDKTLAVMFSTWSPGMQQGYVYKNTLRNWSSLNSRIKTIVFSNDSRVIETATSLGVLHLPVTRTSCEGTPVLRTFFEKTILNFPSTFYGYSNADILFTEGLVKTLKAISARSEFLNVPLLLIGKRIDFNMSLVNDPIVNDNKIVDSMANYGTLRWGLSIDYFFTNDVFPWKLVPDLAIGRPLVDNWLPWFAKKVGVTMIDLSPTVLAVHQMAKGRKIRHISCNMDVINNIKQFPLPQMPLYSGAVDCADYESRYVGNGDVFIIKKPQLYKMCLLDEF